MLVVWQAAKRFQGRSCVSTWLYGIARHKAYKAWARLARPAPELLSAPPAAPAEDDPQVHLLHQERTHTMARVLATLSPEQQTVVTMRYYQDYSLQEIAVRTRTPLNTVRSRLRLAREHLSATLSEQSSRVSEPRAAMGARPLARSRGYGEPGLPGSARESAA